MRSTDIVAYQFNADLYCRPCIRTVAANICESTGFNAEFVPLDRLMAEWSEIAGIEDVDDESSYDSSDFPKAVFAHLLQDTDRCCKCHEELG